jgi:hypothetical protein
MIVRGECEQRRVEANGITLPLQHGALEIVVLMFRCPLCAGPPAML